MPVGEVRREAPTQRREVLNLPVLVLNRNYAPVCLTSCRRAVTLLYSGIARALDTEGETHDFDDWRSLPVGQRDDVIPLVEGATLRVPRVLLLRRYDRTPMAAVRLTRKNLLIRDDYQCQYCAKRPGVRELNVDHVLPKSRSGADSWENLVISCRPCNLRKGQRTPEEASMRLLRAPRRPHWSTTKHILLSQREPYSEWEPFLQAG